VAGIEGGYYKKMYNNKNLKNFRRNLRKNSTDAERKLWQYLRRRQIGNFKFTRQYSVGSYILDFYCPETRLAIEIDGGQHFENKDKDEIRTEFLVKQNIKVIRFWNNEIFNNIDGVLITIRKSLCLEN